MSQPKTAHQHPFAASNSSRSRDFSRAAALALVGTIALTASAKVQVPFWPVPATMQSLVVLLVGAAYGSKLGVATVLMYLAEGLVGLPVFAGSVSGLTYVTGPTSGYLVGFVLAAGLVGWMSERGWNRSLLRAAISMSMGHIVLFIPGVLWLALLFGWPQAVSVGVVPFTLVTFAKTAVGAGIVTAWRSSIGSGDLRS